MRKFFVKDQIAKFKIQIDYFKLKNIIQLIMIGEHIKNKFFYINLKFYLK